MGVKFESHKGELKPRAFGGCGVPRSVFIENRLGFYIHKALHQKISAFMADGSIEFIEEARLLEVINDNQGCFSAVKILKKHTLESILVFADAAIIADGGGAAMYAPSAVSSDKSCDGIVAVLAAGGSIIDMEFVQFHPTYIYTVVSVFDGSLVEEVLRFDGATLLNQERQRFMFDYNPKGEIATRDEVSRGIYSEIIKGNAVDNSYVLLDISCCRQLIASEYPALCERLRLAGYDISHVTKIPIRPTAHFMMGGIEITCKCETSIKGVFCAGESAGGVHGANRLGGNGLGEALVFGRIAGKQASNFVSSIEKTTPNKGFNVASSFKWNINTGKYSPAFLLRQLRQKMYFLAGPIRTMDKLQKMLEDIEVIYEKSFLCDLESGSRSAEQVQQYLDLQNLIIASRMVVTGAMLRQETRGSHFIQDFPKRDSTLKRIKHKQKNGEIIQSIGLVRNGAHI